MKTSNTVTVFVKNHLKSPVIMYFDNQLHCTNLTSRSLAASNRSIEVQAQALSIFGNRQN